MERQPPLLFLPTPHPQANGPQKRAHSFHFPHCRGKRSWLFLRLREKRLMRITCRDWAGNGGSIQQSVPSPPSLPVRWGWCLSLLWKVLSYWNIRAPDALLSVEKGDTVKYGQVSYWCPHLKRPLGRGTLVTKGWGRGWVRNGRKRSVSKPGL